MKSGKWLLLALLIIVFALVPVTALAADNVPTIRAGVHSKYGKPLITWSMTDKNMEYELYNVYRSNSENGEYEMICVGGPSMEYSAKVVDFSAKEGETFFYKVRKLDENRNEIGEFSNVVSATCELSKAPVITKATLSKTTVSAPDVVYLTLGFEESGMGVESASVYFNNVQGGSAEGNFSGGASFTDYKYSGEDIVIPLSIPSTLKTGRYSAYSCQIMEYGGIFSPDAADLALAGTGETWAGLEIDKLEITLVDEFNFNGRSYNLSNPNIVKLVSQLKDGDAAKIFITSGDQIVSKDVFKAIAGKDTTIVFYGDDYSWIFNGKDITEENCKDINLKVVVSNQNGEDFGSENKVTKVEFEDNGKLPGKAEFRIRNKSVYNLFNGKSDIRLYYQNGDDFVREETEFSYKSDKNSEYYTCFDVTHNSTFVISRGALSALPKAPVTTLTIDSTTGKPKVSWKAVEGAKKYEVYRSGTSNGSYTRMLETTKTSYINTDATAGKKYYYKVRYVDSAGIKSNFSTPKYVTCDLAKPTGLKVTTVSSSGKPKVSWSKVTGADKYQLYRKVGSNGSYKLFYTTTGTSVTNTSATAGTVYYYKVKAICNENSAANSAFSASDYVTCDLAKPTGLKVTTVSSSGKPKVSWNKVEGADKYQLYRKVGSNGTYKLFYTTTGTGVTNTSATAGTVYYYKVKAICKENSAANSAFSASDYVTCDLAKPSITVSGTKKPGKIVVSWKKISGADRYYIYRATSKNGTYSKYSSTTGTTYTNSSVTKGKTYYYKVKAIYDGKSAANSAYSNMDYAWVR